MLLSMLINLVTSLDRRRRPVLGCSPFTISCRDFVAEPTQLMIVAHPDDESLFGGEALCAERGWTVVCVTHAGNPVRRREFVRAMERVGANYTMLDHQDNLAGGHFHPSLRETLSRLIKELPYRRIVTHNRWGEYGHPQHRALHRLVTEIAGDVPVDVFSWSPRRPGMSPAKRRLLEQYPSQPSVQIFRYLAERERIRPWTGRG